MTLLGCDRRVEEQ